MQLKGTISKESIRIMKVQKGWLFSLQGYLVYILQCKILQSSCNTWSVFETNAVLQSCIFWFVHNLMWQFELSCTNWWIYSKFSLLFIFYFVNVVIIILVLVLISDWSEYFVYTFILHMCAYCVYIHTVVYRHE